MMNCSMNNKDMDREDNCKVKVTQRDTSVIRVVGTSMDLAVVIIAEG